MIDSNHPYRLPELNATPAKGKRTQLTRLGQILGVFAMLLTGTAHAGTYITGLSLDVAADNTVTVNNTGTSAFSNDSVGAAGNYPYINGWGWASGSILWDDTNSTDTLRIDDSGVDVLNANGIANANGSKSGSVQLTGNTTLGAALRAAYGSGNGIAFTSVIAQGTVDFTVTGTVNIAPQGSTLLIQKAVGTGNPAAPDQQFTIGIRNGQGQVIGSSSSFQDGGSPLGLGGLNPGTYSVNETNIPAGWEVTDISCESDEDSSTFGTFSAGDTSLSIELADGDRVLCTFTNDYSESDLSITKTDDTDPVVAGGDPFTYTVTVTNNGPAIAKNVVVTDTLPAGLTLESTSGCAEDPNGVPTCSLGDIAVDGNAVFMVTVSADADVADGEELVNSVSVMSDSVDPDEANNTFDEGTTANREVDLQVTKECSSDVVAGSGTNNYQCTISVVNNGPSQASNVVISDTFAAIAGVSDASLLLAPSLGSAGIASGVLTWTIATLDPDANSSLPVVRTVSLAAAEGTPLISNTATVTADENDTDDGNDSSTAETNVRWPTASFEVFKEYESGGAGPVEVTLTCTDNSGLIEYDPQTGTTTASLTVRRFDIDPAGSGTSCTITEAVPSGYYEADRSEDCDVDPAADQGEYSCTITNAPTRATFKVTKNFADGNNIDEITVSIDCNTGLILDQDKDLADGESVEFIVTDFTEGALACTITEDGQAGYAGEYDNVSRGNILSDESCDYPAEAIAGNSEHECVITNYPDPVQINVYKDWVFQSSSAPDIDTYIEIEVACDSEIIDIQCPVLGPASDSPADAPTGTIWIGSCAGQTGLNDVGVVATVVPRFPATSCSVNEYVADQAVEQDNGCGSFQVKVNQGHSCVITNTVFFEGIPTLSQYGVALLALLMLGVGLVSFRRFS